MLVTVVFFINILIIAEKLICQATFNYPNPKRADTKDTYFSTIVEDPYQWMENGAEADPDTQKFMSDQNAITLPFLQCPTRKDMTSVLTERFNYDTFTTPEQCGNKFLFIKNLDVGSQSVVYIQDTLEAEPRVLLDVSTLSKDGSLSIQQYGYSQDGSIFSYSVSEQGSDWMTIRFKHIDKDDIINDSLEKVRYSDVNQWTHDNKGLFYSGYYDQKEKSAKQQQQKVYYHHIGTDQTKDVVVAEFPDHPDYLMSAKVTVDGKYLLITTFLMSGNSLYYCDLTEAGEITGKLKLSPIVQSTDVTLIYVTNIDTKFIFVTNNDAPNSQIITINLKDPDVGKYETLISEHPTDALQWAMAANKDYLVANYIRDVKHVMQLYKIDTGELVETFPSEIESVDFYSGGLDYPDMFYSLTSFVKPLTVYRVDLSHLPIEPKVIREVTVAGFDSSMFVTKQEFFKSKDGTQVPIFIIHNKNLELNGRHSCVLYAYGALGLSSLPVFTVDTSFVINDLNGVYAIANVRGGGEYGEQWHMAGMGDQKQNSFDDFHAAAEYLIQNKYTSPQMLAIKGISGGGLLVAACANQRPDLYGAVLPVVGVHDMLRYQYSVAGSTWTNEFGSSQDSEATFKVLYAYSPLHNVPTLSDAVVQYPATFVVTSDHDDRVMPFHSLKFVATLQYKLGRDERQKQPLLLWIQEGAGHYGAETKPGWVEELANRYCFLIKTLNYEFKPPQ